MSYLTLTKGSAPASPAANKSALFVDTADNKPKIIDESGVVSVVTLDGWRDRNVLYNPALEFWQRQAPGSAATYSNVGGRVYGPDRWWTSNETASTTAIRVDTESAKEAGLGTRFYATLTKITNTGKVAFGQTLGATTIMQCRGNKVRLQFMLKTSAPLTLRMGLVQLAAAGTVDTVPISAGTFITAWGANSVDPTLGTNLARITPDAGSADGGTISGDAMSCACTTSWKRFSCVFTVPETAHNLVPMVWTDGQFTAAQTLSFSEVGLYEGAEIRTNFVPYASALEILRCQRYYSKSFNLGTLPAASLTEANEGGFAKGIISKAAATALACVIPIRYPVVMRAAPTVTLYTPIGAGAVPYRITGTTPAVQTAVAQRSPSDSGTTVTATGDANGAVGDYIGVHWTAEAEL
jgi:hypothetical protein